jgi:hypothetical protein
MQTLLTKLSKNNYHQVQTKLTKADKNQLTRVKAHSYNAITFARRSKVFIQVKSK